MYYKKKIKKEGLILKHVYEGILSLKQLSTRFKISVDSIRLIINKYNLKYISPIDCKIIHELEISTPLETICKIFRVKEDKVKRMSKKYSLPLIISRQDRVTERTREIGEFIKNKPNITFVEVGEKYKIGKSRVSQIAILSGVGHRYVNNRKYWKDKCKTIFNSLNTNTDIEKIAKENDITTLELCQKFNYYYGESLTNIILKNRNANITETYKSGVSAKKILKLENDILINPRKINTANHIYSINSKNGFKRFPKIGNRSNGGVFEDRKILKDINRLRNSGKSYSEICDWLNDKNKLTVMGVPFTPANVRFKYLAYQDKKNKRLKY